MKSLGLRVWLFAALVASVTCLQYPLMGVWRGMWLSKFPTYAAQWPNNGPLALVGGYGTDNMDELYSAPMVREMARRWVPRDPWVAGAPAEAQPDYLAYVPLAALQRLTRTMTWTWFAARWLAAFAWFILLYAIARRLSVPEPAAEFAAAFGTAFAYLVGLFFLRGLHGGGGLARTLAGAAWTVVSYGRTENVWRIPRPGVSYAALFAAALAWYRAGVSEKLSWSIAAGVAGGLLCWVRLDVSSGLLGALCAYPVLQALLQRRFDWRWAVPALVALPIGLPMLRWAAHPPETFLLKAGMTGLGGPDWETALYLPLLGWTLWKRRDAPALQTACLLAAVLGICWLPAVTHKGLYTPNWRHYGNLFAFPLLLSLFPRRRLDDEGLWRALTLATLLVAASLNVVYAGLRYPWQGLDADYADAMRWLDRNAPDEAVVAALSPEVNDLLPAFTRCKALVPNGAPLGSRLSLEEEAARARAALRVFRVEPQAFVTTALERASTAEMRERIDRVALDWSFFYSRLFNLAPKDLGERLLRRAPETGYPVQYVWTGPFERAVAPKDFPAKAPLKLERVFANATVRIDRVLETP